MKMNILTQAETNLNSAAQELNGVWNAVSSWFLAMLPRLIGAAVILVAGWYLTNWICKSTRKALSRGKTDPGVITFVYSAMKISLRIVLLVIVAAQLGVETTSIIAALGAAAVAIGLAVKDSLANVASGILLIVTKPFKVGDYIEIEKLEGTVLKIELMFTTLVTADNRNIIIPNSRMASNNVTNYTAQDSRRLELNYTIGYHDDIGKAKKILKDIIDKDDRILRRENTVLGVLKHADNGVVLTLKVWCSTECYWELLFALQERVKEAFDEAGLHFPYPQMDVHLDSSKRAAENDDNP